MRIKPLLPSLLFPLMAWLFSSCAAVDQLDLYKVSYLSIRPTENSATTDPSQAKILLYCAVNDDGKIDISFQNNTDKVMTIDKTKSFFTDSKGSSYPFYNPTINVVSQSSTISNSVGGSVNLGTLSSAVGIDGTVGTVLNGVTLSSGSSSSSTTTTTSYYVDQPQISIAPHAKQPLGMSFYEPTFSVLNYKVETYNNSPSSSQPISRCDITVSFSIDDEQTRDMIQLTLYCNSLMVSPITREGLVNDALRRILFEKQDILDEYWYTLCFSGQERYYTTSTEYKPYNKYYINHPRFVKYK